MPHEERISGFSIWIAWRSQTNRLEAASTRYPQHYIRTFKCANHVARAKIALCGQDVLQP